jgi:hypothetical protein
MVLIRLPIGVRSNKLNYKLILAVAKIADTLLMSSK